MTRQVIRFADRGQGFLEWEVDEAGVIQDSRPGLAHVFVGLRIENLPAQPGKHLELAPSRHIKAAIRVAYPVAEVVTA